MPSESFIVSKKVRGELVVWTETYQNLERGVDAETIVTSSGMSTTNKGVKGGGSQPDGLSQSVQW